MSNVATQRMDSKSTVVTFAPIKRQTDNRGGALGNRHAIRRKNVSDFLFLGWALGLARSRPDEERGWGARRLGLSCAARRLQGNRS